MQGQSVAGFETLYFKSQQLKLRGLEGRKSWEKEIWIIARSKIEITHKVVFFSFLAHCLSYHMLTLSRIFVRAHFRGGERCCVGWYELTTMIHFLISWWHLSLFLILFFNRFTWLLISYLRADSFWRHRLTCKIKVKRFF